METISQQAAFRPELLEQLERVRFRRRPEYDGLDVLSAHFVRHRYPRHTHDTYVMGVVTSGCESFFCRDAVHRAGPDHFCLVEPGAVHDGEPVDGGYEYRMIYPSQQIVRKIADELAATRRLGLPRFASPVIKDAHLARLFVRLHLSLGGEADRLACDELLHRAVQALLVRHAGRIAPDVGHESGPVRRARECIEARFADDLSLDDLAAIARLSRYHFLRAFARETGLTPHAFLVDRRVRAAQVMLRAGTRPVEAAAACGFADQAHLARTFKARTGVTPGAYSRDAG